MKIRIAHSPDSDDAFMFYGLASGKVPSLGYELEHVLSDIETLNRAAFDGTYEITAVSFHAYAHLTEKYILLPHGASMGDRYGPMIVTRSPMTLSDLRGKTIAIPGELTTAFLTLQLAMGRGTKRDGTGDSLPPAAHSPLPTFSYVVVEFDQIPAFVRDGKADAGLIIHDLRRCAARNLSQKTVGVTTVE